jgi:hypothetical protein
MGLSCLFSFLDLRPKILWRDRKLAQPIVVRNAIEAARASFFGFCDLDQICGRRKNPAGPEGFRDASCLPPGRAAAAADFTNAPLGGTLEGGREINPKDL